MPEEKNEGLPEIAEGTPKDTKETPTEKPKEKDSRLDRLEASLEKMVSQQAQTVSQQDALMRAIYSSPTEPEPSETESKPPSGEGERNWDEMFRDEPGKAAKALLGEVKRLGNDFAQRVVRDMTTARDTETRRDTVLADVRDQNPELFDQMKQTGLLAKAAVELETNTPGFTAKSEKDQLQAIVDHATTGLKGDLKGLIGLFNRKQKDEDDASGEHPTPGRSSRTLHREVNTAEEAAEVAWEEIQPEIERAIKFEKEEGIEL